MSLTKWFSSFPSRKFFDELESKMGFPNGDSSGLTVSSDDKNVYIEAQLPGLTSKDVEVSIDNDHILWIKGEKKSEEEDKKKKYYRRSQSSFSYCIPLWEEIDQKEEPKAVCKDGVMKITFSKKKEQQAPTKKIQVNDEK